MTLVRKRAASAAWPANSHAPPVPWRLTGVPACRATAPSWATAAPDPLATARESRWSSNSAQPAARRRRPDEADGPARQPGPSQCRPQRVGGDRLGGLEGGRTDAHHDRVARCAARLWRRRTRSAGSRTRIRPRRAAPAGPPRTSRRGRRSEGPPRAAAASRATPAVRRPCPPACGRSGRGGSSTGRARSALATSERLASRIGRTRSSSARLAANCSKNSSICASVTRPSSAKAAAAAPTASTAARWSAAGTCSRAPVSCTTINRSPATNASASSSGTWVRRSPPNTIGCPGTSSVRRSAVTGAPSH